ncbi:MAG: hypothetical protein V2A73_04735, partial [Pseudomonadota bacterium]
SLTLTGTGFVQVNGIPPTVAFGGVTVAATSLDDCTAIVGTTLGGAESCTTLHLTVPREGIGPGEYQVTVSNPGPAGCTSNEAVTVAVAGPPKVDRVEPAAMCADNQPAEMTIAGQGFLVATGIPADQPPVVEVDGDPVAVTGWSGCAQLGGTTVPVKTCTSLSFTVPDGGFSMGAHDITITNSTPTGCGTSVRAAFSVAAPPVLASVAPYKVCTVGGSFRVNGLGFVPGSQIQIGSGGAYSFVDTIYVSATQIDGSLSAGMFPAGLYDVNVSNGAGCESTPLAAALRLVDAPIVFYVDPPRAYSGIDLAITIYASGITDSVGSVAIRRTGTTGPPISLDSFSYDVSRPNRILAILPASLGLVAGDYDVLIEDVACSAELPGGLHVTDTLTVDVATIELPFGHAGERTPVTIRSTDPAPEGMASFAATPRAYLSPHGGGATATELRAVSFLDPYRLTGTVPETLAAGTYDLVVINPDGGVGLLASAFRVVPNEVPVIAAVAPASVVATDGAQATVYGEFFASDATASASCVSWSYDSILGKWVPAYRPITASATTFVDAETLNTSWDFAAAGIPVGAACVVRVTNVADNTWAELSALQLTGPSANPNAFRPSPSMLVGRRAAAAAAVRMNALERYLFAIGGDDGNVATPTRHSSVEAVKVDAYGNLEAWELQRSSLPAGRSFTAAAVIGRFVYLPGGNVDGGTSASASVLRAYLLDPFEAPEILDLDIALREAGGLDAGIWYYRVAAVLDGSDPNNPGGEALASEPLVVELPSFTGFASSLTLFWTSVPHAAAYRIYRTPTPGMSSGAERLLAEMVATGAAIEQFTDNGTLTIGVATPMPLGSLGTWHEVGPLGVARQGAGVVAVPDPGDPTRAYLYVIGGLDAGGTTAQSTIELATLTTAASNSQAISAFAPASASLPTGRWQLGAVWIDRTRATATPAGHAWFYALTGVDAAGSDVSEITAFQIDTAAASDGTFNDGRINQVFPVTNSGMGGGYGYTVAANYIYFFGGGGTPTKGGKSGKICNGAAGEASCTPNPPQVKNWNAGISTLLGRDLHATAWESGFVFLIGGATDEPSLASTSTEMTNL